MKIIPRAFRRLFSGILTVSFLLCLAEPSGFVLAARAASESAAPDPGSITVKNNAAGSSDTVYIYGLAPKDVVRIYNASGKQLAQGTVSSSSSEITIKISQLGTVAGSILVSVTSSGCTESAKTSVDYGAEPESEAIPADSVTVTNNAKGTYDSIYIYGLTPKDIVKVYNASGKLLTRKTVAASDSEITIKISQLGSAAGVIYLTVTNSGCNESAKTEVSFDAEPQSDAPPADCITVTNNAVGTADTVYVTGLSPKDTVKVYNAASNGKLLGKKTVASTGSDVTISISQLGSAAGSVFVSVTGSGYIESARTEVSYSAEKTASAPELSLINITNNPKGTADTICVSGLDENDQIKVYNAASGGTLLGKATASASTLEATVKVSQLGSSAGTVYVSRKGSGTLESSRVAVSYSAEITSASPSSYNITVTNNPQGTADTVTVRNVYSGDVVKVYNSASGGSLLGKVTATGSEATVSISQLGTSSGSVFISVTSSSMNESPRVEAVYEAESGSTAPSTSSILVTNNPSGTDDTVYVSGLTKDDVVRVYNSSGTVLGKATATGTTLTISITQLGTTTGSVFVTVTSTGKAESARTEVEYDAEASSAAPDAGNITVTNNAAGTADTVYVTGLLEGDVVSVYSSSKKGTALGTATVAPGTAYATVSITQLGTAAGKVYVTVTSEKSTESGCTEVSYSAEGSSDALSLSKIVIVNNVSGKSDSVSVSGLSENDVVKVYNKAVQGDLLGTATSDASGTVTISVQQLGTASGSVFLTVTSKGKTESAVTEAPYAAEAASSAPLADNIKVTNNASGTADTVYVSGLASGDTVNVYRTAAKTATLGSASVEGGATYATVSIAQLGSTAGEIYVSVTSTDSLESALTKVSYSAEAQTNALSESAVSVTNNYKSSDTIVVSGLTYGDVIKVYDKAAGGSLLGTVTVSSTASTASITVEQLGTASGKVYVTKTSKNLQESEVTEVSYDAEPVSTAPEAGNVTIENYAGASDTITLIGLNAGDIVTVYKTATGSNTWGSGTVASSSSSITITVPQLGSAAGIVYVSVTSASAAESARTAVSYSEEPQSAAPSADNVTVVNNYNTKSTVTVKGLANNDTVNIYNASTGGELLGTGTVSAYGTSVTISLSGLSASGGTIYVTVTNSKKSESARTAVSYSSQSVSTAPSASDVTIVNNADLSDKLTIKNLNSGTIINVYDSETNGTLLGTATSSGTSVTITVDQLGAAAGSVYITATTTGKTESARTKVDYEAESASEALNSGNVKIVNNSGASDTISITGLANGDIVKIYKTSSGVDYIATATATGDLTTTISISQLGTSSGSIYVSVTTSGKTESARTEIEYAAESTAPLASSVTVVNNAGISDTITVANLSSGDLVNVYSDATGSTLIGTASVSSGASSVTITVSQLSTTSGYVYVSVTNSGLAESSLTKVSYLAEKTTDAPDEGDIYIVNNASGTSDTVTVYNLSVGDVVKVYNSEGTVLGKATVLSGSTSATVTISDLGSASGSVFVSVKTKGKYESKTTEIIYSGESQSAAPYAGSISIVNNVSIADTITVSDLNPTDLVKVYSSTTATTCLGYSAVNSGSTSVTISIPQLGTAAGKLYISVTRDGKTESARTEADYAAESQSSEVSLSSVAVANNATGTADTITVTGLSAGSVIQVYDLLTGGTLLGSATASEEGTVTISVAQLGASAGSVYVSCTEIGKSESARTKVNYAAE